MLGPLDTRADVLRCFVRDRRRVMMGVDSRLAETPEERSGMIRQRWRRVLEMHLVSAM